MKTKVVFRVWEKEIIALFPEIPSDNTGYHCESYMRVGQHSGADYEGIIHRSRPAIAVEYLDLAKELNRIGYDLEIRNRCTPTMRELRYVSVNEKI